MKKRIKGISMVFMVFLPLLFSDYHELKASSNCFTANPNDIYFGLRGNEEIQPITITSAGTWGGYVSASWIKINGGGTISSGGNATVNVSFQYPIPPGVPGGLGCGDTITSGSITFYHCSGTTVIPVHYIICPCC